MKEYNQKFLVEIIDHLQKIKKFNELEKDFGNLPCSVWAHISNLYHQVMPSNHEGDHWWGMTEFRNRFVFYENNWPIDTQAWRDRRLRKILHQCGASFNPFGPEPWLLHPAEVFTKFLKKFDELSAQR